MLGLAAASKPEQDLKREGSSLPLLTASPSFRPALSDSEAKLLLSRRQQEQPSFLTSTEHGGCKTLVEPGNGISASNERFFSWLLARAVS